ncbi:MAG: addiction module protein, partial [Chitinophagaceae bacterium]
DEIKKLPNEEKLKIIDELWESIEDDWEKTSSEENSPEVLSLLEERLEEYEKGEKKSYNWDELEIRVRYNLEQQKNGKK